MKELRKLAEAAINYRHGFYDPNAGITELKAFAKATNPTVILKLLDRLEAAEKDAKRYCAVLGMSSNQMLRLYNMRFDLREQRIDAVMDEAAIDKAMEAK